MMGVTLDDECPWCGEERWVDLLECWPEERAFILDSCCGESERDLQDQLEWAAGMPSMRRVKFLAPLRELFAGWGLPIRQVYESQDEMALRLDFGLQLGEVKQSVAKEFVRTHHRHNPPPAGWRWGHGLYNGGDLIAVAMVGRPVARMLDHTEIVEVNRLCVRPDIDPELTWNACSMLYGAAARRAKVEGFSRIITYTLETEDGTTLKAAGWEARHQTRGGRTWDTPSRRREQKSPTCAKVRWERDLAA